MTDARLTALHVYPVKGCRGIPLTTASVAVTGLTTAGVSDREWMAITAEGTFITQREYPRLALVHTAVSDGALMLSAPDVAPLAVPLSTRQAISRPVVVWRSSVAGIDAGDEAAAWLSAWLGTSARLLRFDRSVTRECNTEFVGDSGAHTYFADGYPVLVASASSLDELNERLAARGESPLPMNRFRPNLVLSDLPAFSEDHIATITIGDVVLQPVKPCVRCQVTTTNQETAEVGIEPLRTLGEFRMDEQFGGVTFGMNAIVVAGAGRALNVGANAAIDYRF